MFATVSYHLPNLAFHTDACSPLFLPGSYIENDCKSRRLSELLIQNVSQLFLAEPF